jgi:adenine-specific DNA methylase
MKKDKMDEWLKNYKDATSVKKQKMLVDVITENITWHGIILDVYQKEQEINDEILNGYFIITKIPNKATVFVFFGKTIADVYSLKKGDNYYSQDIIKIFDISKKPDELILLLVKKSKINQTEEIFIGIGYDVFDRKNSKWICGKCSNENHITYDKCQKCGKPYITSLW